MAEPKRVLVDPRIEHLDVELSVDDAMFIELVDATGESIQIFFTTPKAVGDFSLDLSAVIQGEWNGSHDDKTPTDALIINTSASQLVH